MTPLNKLKLHAPKILLMGQFGTGKTLWATTLGSKCLVLDLDNGLRSALTFKDKHFNERQLIDVKTCWEEDANRATAFSKFASYLKSIGEECRQNKFERQALIIDGYTSLADFSVRDVLARNGLLGKAPQIQHWGLAFIQIEQVLMELRSLPIVVVMIAHIRRVEVKEETKYEIASPGQKLPDKIPPYFDEVWVTEIKGSGSNQKYVCKTKGTSVVPCRTRGNIGDNLDMNRDLGFFVEELGFKWKVSEPTNEPTK